MSDPLPPAPVAPSTRAGFAAVIGAPNAGKSTLVNRLVGSKVTIVSRKVQTTRFPVRGVAMAGSSQIVLIDTPGVFAPRRRLDRAMVRSAWTGAEEAECLLHVVDAEGELALSEGRASPAQQRSAADDRLIVERLEILPSPRILVLNKIDAVRRERLLEIAARRSAEVAYAAVFMVSAETGSGVPDLKERLGAEMPPGAFLYPPDQSADLPTRLLAAEITREKLYLRVHEELPYAAGVETTQFEERADGSVRIEQTIFLERDSQRPILLGKSGRTIKWIGQRARGELAELLEREVHLFLHVKVEPDWQERREHYLAQGLDFDAA